MQHTRYSLILALAGLLLCTSGRAAGAEDSAIRLLADWQPSKRTLQELIDIVLATPFPDATPGKSRYNWGWLKARYDSDGDGVITPEEFTGPKEYFARLRTVVRRNPVERVPGVLSAMDFDWSQENPELRRRGGPPPGKPPGGPGTKGAGAPGSGAPKGPQGKGGQHNQSGPRAAWGVPDQMLALFNPDHDGRITREHWIRVFEQVARDKDYVTRESLGEAFQRTAQELNQQRALMSIRMERLENLLNGPTGKQFNKGPGKQFNKGPGKKGGNGPGPGPGKMFHRWPEPGEEAPGFTLTTQDGKRQISLSDYRGKKPVVLVFGSIT